jgi:hypothetical protein
VTSLNQQAAVKQGYRAHTWILSDGMWLCETCDAFAVAACWRKEDLDGLCGRGLTYKDSNLPDFTQGETPKDVNRHDTKAQERGPA